MCSTLRLEIRHFLDSIVPFDFGTEHSSPHGQEAAAWVYLSNGSVEFNRSAVQEMPLLLAKVRTHEGLYEPSKKETRKIG